MDPVDLLPSFELSLRARNKAPRTITSYAEAVRMLNRFLARQRMPVDAEQIERKHVEAFIADQIEQHSASTASVRYKSLQQFFRWAEDEDEVDRSPMAKMGPPDVVTQPVPVLTDDTVVALLRSCDGRDFTSRRDNALVRMFVDTGARLEGIVSLTVHDVDLDAGMAEIVLKGRREHEVPFGSKTAQALDRYLRARRRHPHGELAHLWLGPKGPLTGSGVAQMLKRRCTRLGLPPIHPHQFRHTTAHTWLLNDGGEGDLMRIMGWESREMLDRYARSAATARAHTAHKRLGLADRF
jgi:site-specific recombinase XerD